MNGLNFTDLANCNEYIGERVQFSKRLVNFLNFDYFKFDQLHQGDTIEKLRSVTTFISNYLTKVENRKTYS